jgi:hypothetical protein
VKLLPRVVATGRVDFSDGVSPPGGGEIEDQEQRREERDVAENVVAQ